MQRHLLNKLKSRAPMKCPYAISKRLAKHFPRRFFQLTDPAEGWVLSMRSMLSSELYYIHLPFAPFQPDISHNNCNAWWVSSMRIAIAPTAYSLVPVPTTTCAIYLVKSRQPGGQEPCNLALHRESSERHVGTPRPSECIPAPTVTGLLFLLDEIKSWGDFAGVL